MGASTHSPSADDSKGVAGTIVLTVLAVIVGLLFAFHAAKPETITTYVDQHGRRLDPSYVKSLLAKNTSEGNPSIAPFVDSSVPTRSDTGISRNIASPSQIYSRTSIEGDLRSTANLSSPQSQYVRGYVRKDGRVVEGYNRSKPNDTQRDNWTTRGNINPVTGSQGRRKATR
jgi:hypothetical protein